MFREHLIEADAPSLNDVQRLYELYKGWLVSFILRHINDEDVAVSIANDSLLKAHMSRERFRGNCSVKTYLGTIALNMVRDHHKSPGRRFWREAARCTVDARDFASVVPDRRSSPELVAVAKQRVALVFDAVGSLPPQQAKLFRMRFEQELDLNEIACEVGLPLGTVKTHICRAVKKVRMQLAA